MLFVHQSVIAAPVHAVFAFHERPDALRLLTPPWEPVQVIRAAPSLQPGERALIKVKLGPVWIEWEAEHTRYEKDVLFQDKQVRGPFRRWLHTHHMSPVEGGTLLRDEVDLELPFGLLARPAWPLVRGKLERMFAHRHAVTREACSGLPHDLP